jgi:hypothetical protein
MTTYRVSFFKNLQSSDGHAFKCVQQVIEIRRAKSPDRAVRAAERRYERRHHVPDWQLYADTLELEISRQEKSILMRQPLRRIRLSRSRTNAEIRT